MNKITTNIKEAVKVRFLQPIFEEGFVERGMKAWLTNIEWHENYECYELFFDMTEFEQENDKYLTNSFYYPSKETKEKGIEKALYTAKEAGCYDNKFSDFYSLMSGKRDDEVFEKEILEYLEVIE